MKRRRFFEQCAILAGIAGSPPSVLPAFESGTVQSKWRETSAQIVVVGGGLGGCAAALAAARGGAHVLMTEETDWIGGQMTQQAVPPDEHPWIESFGCTRSYRQLRDGIRDYYRHHYPLKANARARKHLDPGNGLVSRLCHEPRVALAAIYEMLAPYLSGGTITLLLGYRPVAAETDGDRVRAVRLRNLVTGDEVVATGDYFIDATEQGDLLPLAGAEHVTGFESQKQTGEPHAPSEPQPANIQAVTCCFALDYLEGEDHTIDKPADYKFWRDYVPAMTPAWPGKLLSWDMSHPITPERWPVAFDPRLGDTGKLLNLWLYRRIADRKNFAPGTYPSDITIVNWPQNDYWLGNLHEVPEEESGANLRQAKQLSLSLVYWLQTEAPRLDGGSGWRGLRLRRDVMGTEDGLAKYPYIRESRRIEAEFTVLEQHVGTDARMEARGRTRDTVTSETFADSVGVGSYRIDLHPSAGGDNYIDISSLPFQIPLGALVPRRVENLLAGCKNLGVTHITNGCYRLHPVEWNIGEAAGALAVFCMKKGEVPRRVRNNERLLQMFQSALVRDGVEIEWPRLRPR